MKKLLRLLTFNFSLLTLNFSLASCEREPMLYLVDREQDIEFETERIILDLDVLWEYELTYDWEAQWFYGWDNLDDNIFGSWDIIEPNVFNVRRYFTGEDKYAPHTSVLKDKVTGTRFQAKYKFGFYDVMVWNDVNTLDGVQSLHFDEETTLETVVAYTNQAMQHTSVPPQGGDKPNKAPTYNQDYKAGYAFYQPEFLFAGHYDDLHVSDDPADYDSLIVETNTWYKFVPLVLRPVTYIYLTQVILHNNKGRIAGIDGTGNFTGLARSVNLYSHVTSSQDISVNYPLRMKTDVTYTDSVTELSEQVDIIGGRVMTFGLTSVDPYMITRASNSYQDILASSIPNYMELDVQFHNGMDSTMIFDVTNQVREHYKGGVITIHLDVDEVPIPSKGGGSMFDAIVVDPEEETHEFEM